MSSRSTFNCFGLVIHGYGWPELEFRISNVENQPVWIVTANPEILVWAKRHADYWEALRRADLRLVDGFGLQLFGWLKKAKPKRLTGVDLAGQLLANAEKNKLQVMFVGGAPGVAEQASWSMRQKFPELRVIAEAGGRVNERGVGDFENLKAVENIKLKKPEYLFVAFGHPKQELWINRYFAELKDVKVIVGVGGTFDYWSGRIRRAPKLLKLIGFEWLWRLMLEPRRWKRILTAVFIFPWLGLVDSLRTAHNKVPE